MSQLKKFIQNLKESKGVFVSFAIIALCFFYFSQRYVIAVNGANSDCLEARYFLVDRWNKTYQPGHIVAFQMNVETELFPTGDGWIKKVAGIGATEVHVDDYTVKGHGKVHRASLGWLLNELNINPDDIQRVWHLAEDELFMIGETATSYDSRIWGPIKKADVIGRAYALL